jgi:hypothetical protein
MKTLLLLLAMLSGITMAEAQTKLPEGKWQNVDDDMHSWVVKGDDISTCFMNKPVDKKPYTLSQETCDADYVATKEAPLYLSWAGVCYEIVLLDETTLKLIATLKMANPNMEFKREAKK